MDGEGALDGRADSVLHLPFDFSFTPNWLLTSRVIFANINIGRVLGELNSTMEADELKQYLQTMVNLRKSMSNNLYYCGIEDLLLQEGQPFTKHGSYKNIKKDRIGQCYQNAFQLALYAEGYQYVEGVATHEGLIPMAHAWTVDEQGLVVDSTWKAKGVAYWGLAIPHDFLNAQVLATKHYGVLDDWPNGHPILQEKLDFEKLTNFYTDLYYSLDFLPSKC